MTLINGFIRLSEFSDDFRTYKKFILKKIVFILNLIIISKTIKN